MRSTAKLTSIRLDLELADRAAKALGVKTWTAAVDIALGEIVATEMLKDLMAKQAGKLKFAGCDG